MVAGLDTQKELFNDGQGNYSKTLNSVFGCTTNSALDDYVTNTVSNFANYGWFYMTMPNKFVGKNIITLPYGDNGNSVAFASNDQITLTVTKNTRIYVSTDEDWLTPGGKLFGTFDSHLQVLIILVIQLIRILKMMQTLLLVMPVIFVSTKM